MDGNCTEARCGGRGLDCVQHEWVRVLFRLHNDDGCNKRYGAAVCSAAGQAACFGIMLDMGKQLFSESSSSSLPKHFLGGRVWWPTWPKFIQSTVMRSSGGLEAPRHNLLGSPNSYSHWNGHIAAVVSVDDSLVVRISEDACPSVTLI